MVCRVLCCACLGLASVTASASGQLVFEAEDLVVNRDALQENKSGPTNWNLWSTDKDAMKKWSGGVVIQSPPVKTDRKTPEEGAPPLHLRVTDLPKGIYNIEVTGPGRVAAISLDGKTWQRFSGGSVASFLSIDCGVFEFWFDDRYAMEREEQRGSTYLDRVVVTRLTIPTKKVEGWATERAVPKVDRGVVALPTDKGVYVSWRLLAEDPAQVGFNVFRKSGGNRVQLNSAPITRTCDFLDQDQTADSQAVYEVAPVDGSGPTGQAALATPASKADELPYVRIKLKNDDTKFMIAGFPDLNGDGAFDVVIKHPSANIDPWHKYWYKSPETYKIEAYLNDGTYLWTNDLGWAIERGIWYSPWIAADLTGDGKAEIAAKIGEGDPRDEDGKVTSGPEWIAVWDGMTGKEITRAPWPDRSEFPEYNYASRNQIAVAYLDGKTPCLLALRGTYNRMFVFAFQLKNGKLEQLWKYDNKDLGREYWGQGAHFTLCYDVDKDGRDEVILGSTVLDDTGGPLWTTGKGHPDAAYLTDVDPNHPGLEIAYVVETRQRNGGGLCLADAATGELLWELDESTKHVHSKGMCADIDPTVRGMEVYGADADGHKLTEHRWLFAADGTLLKKGTDCKWSFAIRTGWWDADLQREIVESRVSDYNGGQLDGRIEGSIKVIADVIGDWREEVITSVAGELRIYSTTIPATDRRVCLMQDDLYRMCMKMNTMGYSQALTLSYNPEAISPGLNLTYRSAAKDAGTCQVVVSAPNDRDVRGTLDLSATENLSLSPPRLTVDVKPGQCFIHNVQVTSPAKKTIAGEVKGTLTMADGAVLTAQVPAR